MARLEISRIGLELIESFEGFRARAIRLNNGSFTIGFGHKATAREGMVINREQAEELLRWDLGIIEDFIRQNALLPLVQNQYDAIVSFAFNIGLEAFKTSDVLRHLNRGEPVAAAIAMSAWRHAHLNGQQIVVDALVRRRTLEAAMFLDTHGPRPAAPSSVITPLLDYRASLLAPRPDDIKEIGFERANGEAIIKEEKPKDIQISEDDKDIFLADYDEANNENVVPFPNFQIDEPIITTKKTEVAKIDTPIEIEAANIANEIENIPANDLEKPNAAIALEAISEPVFKAQTVLKSKRNDFDPLTIFVIFAGLIAFLAGLYEALAQNIFQNGLFQIGNNSGHVFIALTLVIGLVASLLGIISLIVPKEE